MNYMFAGAKNYHELDSEQKNKKGELFPAHPFCLIIK